MIAADELKLREIDLDCVRAAREAAGDNTKIMLDVNCPWSVREALDMTSKLRPFNLRTVADWRHTAAATGAYA
jgi:L-alanine-DL-glutamate epimerase-like enolase superfamily enzyme